ncbi:MAG TPA: GntR family transcriptional regulator [Methylomirabilota bacterium]|nr:GntR family transcriptional regulator [Methylomirabilota bacterium]
MFTSVRAPRVYEHIVEQVERAIFAGRLRSGDRLPPERELVHQFRASRVAVREALRTLEHRGLIEVRHGSSGGHFVRHVDASLLRRDFATLFRLGRVTLPQLTEARLMVEPEIARLAAERATEPDLQLLADAVDGQLEAKDRFHRLLAAAARNPVHAVLVDALTDLGPRPCPEDDEAVSVAHKTIFAAVAARDPERARAAMAAHVVDVQRRLGRTRSEAS